MLRDCDRCGLLLPEHHLSGGLCTECQFDWELTVEPATTHPGMTFQRDECALCGVLITSGELCDKCDPTN